MALYGYGVNAAKALDPSPESILDPGLFGGKLRVMQDYATISASSNLNSTDYIIVGGKLPLNSQVVKIVLGSSLVGLSTDSTLVVGDEADADRYITSSSVTGNAVIVGPKVAGGMYYAVTEKSDNYIRIAGAGNASILSSGTLKVSVFYVVE